ncbi:hypothetical protein [Actinocrispum wychmicini]|uniref:Uncharacterized protein n=1 Tax=Actinocrispum wychmicini TaxID=1213861 RepID=A0A4R2JKR5_9PSEU|nr:hypothetical protein [Actinocrispum wychmicini]TCO59754.1 hypothetical protein EV192_104597 [Actinocrispum wychmicini]
MPRPLMNTDADAASSGQLRPRPTKSVARDRLLTTRRSATYLRAIRELDAAGHVAAVDLARIVDDFRREFEDANCSTPVGIVSRCYLGAPYEVHTLALDGSIVEHYETGKQLPGGLERARSYAMSVAFDAIEVYPDRLVCVRVDGSVVALEGAE